MVHLGVSNDELFDVAVANGAAHCKFTINAMHAILASDPAAVIHDAITLILPRGRLVNGDFANAAVLLEEESTRVAHVCNRHLAVVQETEEERRAGLQVVLARDLKKLIVDTLTH